MVVKVLTLLLVLGAIVWMIVPRRPAVGAGRKPMLPRVLRVPRAHDLEKCGRCGIWLPAGQRCDCTGRG